MNQIIWVLLVVVSTSVARGAEDSAAAKTSAEDTAAAQTSKGFVDFNYYYDTRDLTLLTVNTLATLRSNFEYFSLVNYEGTSAGATADTTVFYTEQNLRWPVRKGRPFAISTQWVGQNGDANDLIRFGGLMRLEEFEVLRDLLDGSANSFSINIFPLQLDSTSGNQWQVEYFYRFQLLPRTFGDRFYLSGFADQNLDEDFRSNWVTEHQVGVRFVSAFYAVAEFRHNDLLPSDKSGWGLGLEYVMNW